MLAATALLVLGAAQAQTQAVRDLPSRPGVTQRYLWQEPERFDATVVLLIGGAGNLNLSAEGVLGAGAGNFLARSRDKFLAQGLAVALVDAPSDRQSPPYLSGFRQSAEHATDLRSVIADIRQRTSRPVVLVGTSRGTQSAAAVAIATLDAGGPNALVLTSSILNDPKSRALPQMDLEPLRLPVLVVHHEQDACRLCLFSDLPLLTAKLKAPFKVLSYQGGTTRGDACEAMAYHGYNGIEAQVVQDIAAWIQATLIH
ncbi:alpha/beta hydrolase [Rhodoferax lacus]|uniref:Alpha/beta hydrolase n=1 Tax=Rhodoferax lacus TaxID=2184758 RepID=A0A3E1RBW0_9BURK|nr:alpha/beta hydrolase [Rhodoferax lacus]